MVMKYLKYVIMVLCLIVGIDASAEIDKGLSDLMKQRAQQKIAQMNDNISFMADKSRSLDTRKYYRKTALKLFIGNGEPYEFEGIPNTGVKMETTSKFRKKPNEKLMKDYFSGLINLRYSKVDIKTTNVYDIEISEIRPIDENTYVCTGIFEQKFIGYKDGQPQYIDRMWKKVNIYILREVTIDGEEFVILLGDVKALETTDLDINEF